MSAGKPFDELTDAELQELDEREWTSEEIVSAIGLALKEGSMEAVVQLLHRLALVDPLAARVIHDTIKLAIRANG